MKTEKPEWLKLKEAHDAELITDGLGRERPRSLGKLYNVNQGHFQTDQTGADQCDLNKIMARVQRDGSLPELIAQGMQSRAGIGFQDFSDPMDFQQAMTITAHANQQFDLLPSKLRNRFNNNPAEFLQFMSDDKNAEEQHKLGLRAKNKPKEPETTLKDLVKAVQETAKPKKTTPKGEDPSE